MKKIQIIAIISLFTLLMVSCASKKKNSKKEAEAPAVSVEEAVVDAEQSADTGKKSKKTKKKAEKEKKSKKSKSEDNAEDTKKTKKLVKNVSVDYGIIQLNAKTKLGTFNVGVINENGKVIQALSSSNESSGNVFYLKYGKKIYKLQSEVDIHTAAAAVPNGMRLTYTINNVADVYIDFICMKSSADVDADILKITSTVVNKGTRKIDIGLKCVLDTVLGESNRNHFYSSSNVPINAEVIYRTMKNEKWFLTKNNDVAMQILLDGANITVPDIVALGNKATLNSMAWEPNVSSTRAFDTVLSYNDSCACVLWPSSLIAAGDSKSYNFYLAFDNTGHTPQGAKFINPVTVKTELAGEKIVNNVLLIEPPVENKPSVVTISDVPVITPAPVITPVPETSSTVKEPVEISEEQISPEYIQQLIDRITELESDGSNTDPEELNRLTQELDAIFDYLR